MCNIVWKHGILWGICIILTCISRTIDSQEKNTFIYHETRNQKSEIIGTIRSYVGLPCRINPALPDIQKDQIIWQKKSIGGTFWEPMIDFCKKEENENHCRITKHPQSNTITLHFVKFYEKDVGRYSCGQPLNSDADLETNDYIMLLQNPSVDYEFEYGKLSTITTVNKRTELTCNLKRGPHHPKEATYQVRWSVRDHWIDPTEYGPDKKYDHRETNDTTTLIINKVVSEDGGIYECALFNQLENPQFSPDRIVASFEFLLRVHSNFIWAYPIGTIAVEVIIVAIIMFFVDKKWIPDGDNSSDEEDIPYKTQKQMD